MVKKTVLGKGSFGCVVSPYFIGDDDVKHPESSVSKIFIDKSFRDIEYRNTLNFQKIIDPRKKATVTLRGSNNVAMSPELNKMISKCALPSTVQVFPQIIMDNGGIELETFFHNGNRLSFMHWIQ